MTREINLQEYRPCGPYSLTTPQLRAIEAVGAGISITPDSQHEGAYTLTASSKVGAFETSDLSILIQPKIGILQLLSLACYAIGEYKPDDSLFDYEERNSLPDALALALGTAARRAFSRGLAHGYRTREEALQTVRGRIRFNDQIRHRYGIAPPVEVRYQEFTDDVLENQLIKAAAYRLGHLRPRAPRARQGLGWIAGMLDNVSHKEFAPQNVPDPKLNRLNEHYANVITLARLILRHGEFESKRGDIRATGFLMDMNKVFQEFVTAALTEALQGTPGELRTDNYFKSRRLPFDRDSHIGLEPDLAWQRGGKWVWVGDAKYKDLSDNSVDPADLYQMLAYTTALNLPGGTLIYAKGEADPQTYTVNHAGKSLEVVALDLELPLDEVLGQVRTIADRLRAPTPRQ